MSTRYTSDRGGAQTEVITPDDGDRVVLIVGREDAPTGLQKLVVSGPVLRQLSTPWRQYTHDRYWRKDSLTFVLREDDADMVRLLMYIAHIRFELVPRQLDLGELVELSRIVERYQVHKAMLGHIGG
jgi:hypothetical protein